jgi:histidine triad (HIT) family protein
LQSRHPDGNPLDLSSIKSLLSSNYFERACKLKNCIFCKIVSGEIPSVKVYEDELVMAFLDIAPINFGHMLVIPKDHHTSAATIPENISGRMMSVGSRLGVAAKRALDLEGFNLHLADGACAGQVVMHAHLHVIPRGVEDGFHWGWRQKKYENDNVRSEIAGKIISKFKLPATE